MAQINDNLAPLIANIPNQLAVYQNGVSHATGQEAEEEVILCYTSGNLEFTHFNEGKGNVRYGLLDMDLFNLDGRWNGRYQVVWKPEDPEKTNLEEIPTPKYTGPFDKVVDTIPKFSMRANSNAAYTFAGNGGTGKGILFATGPANLLITPYKDGGSVFQISVATFVTGGTGDFEGARGTNTALGSSFIAAGVNVSQAPEGFKIPGVTVSTFRIIRGSNVATPGKK